MADEMDHKDDPKKPAATPKTVREVAAAADFRNAKTEAAFRGLELLERRFREGDPVRDAIVKGRRQVAKPRVATKETGDGPTILK